MSYLIRRVLAKPRLILDEMCRLYGKFASYLRRVLCKMRLIFPRINGPNVNIRNATFGDFLCVITAEQVVTEITLFAMAPLLRFMVLRVLNVVGALSNYKRFIINQ